MMFKKIKVESKKNSKKNPRENSKEFKEKEGALSLKLTKS